MCSNIWCFVWVVRAERRHKGHQPHTLKSQKNEPVVRWNVAVLWFHFFIGGALLCLSVVVAIAVDFTGLVCYMLQLPRYCQSSSFASVRSRSHPLLIAFAQLCLSLRKQHNWTKANSDTSTPLLLSGSEMPCHSTHAHQNSEPRARYSSTFTIRSSV